MRVYYVRERIVSVTCESVLCEGEDSECDM